MFTRLKNRLRAWRRRDTLTLSSGDVLVPNGTRLDVYDASRATLKRSVVVTSRDGTVLTLDRLTWWKSLWLRFKAWRESQRKEAEQVYAPNVCEKCGWMHPLGVRECASQVVYDEVTPMTVEQWAALTSLKTKFRLDDDWPEVIGE